MIAEMRETLPPASAVIVGEPTMMQTVTGHKGVVGMSTHVRGFEVHSSLVHTGVSAVMTAAKLVAWLDAQMAANAAAAPKGSDEISGADFNPPYTTLHVGVIHGGTAHNITAKDCEFSTDIRVIPSESVETWRDRYLAEVARVEAEIRKIRPEARIDVTVRATTPGCRKEENGAAEALVRALTGDNSEHVVSYGTEAGQFQDEGYSTVICGPGSIAQAHQANEFIAVEQLEAGAAFMRKLIERQCR
jgi:acetylornithine deacetylase